MSKSFQLTILLLAAGLGGCGGAIDLSCDEVQYYQRSDEGERVQSPEGLDDLDPLKEVPLPESSPRESRPPGSDCFDRPPKVRIGN